MKKNKLEIAIERELKSGKLKVNVKDKCFVCGAKIVDWEEPFQRYLKRGNSCKDCYYCSEFAQSSLHRRLKRYKRWCLRLRLLDIINKL